MASTSGALAPVFPTIPTDEYPQRWRRVQALMRAEKLDLLLAYGDDRAVFGAGHVRWLADFPVHFEPALVVLAPDGDPVLLTGPESDAYGSLRGRIADVRVLREFTHPDEDYPYSRIDGLAGVVGALMRRGAPSRAGAPTAPRAGAPAKPRAGAPTTLRVGIAGRSLVSWEMGAALENALPGVEWVDCERLLYGLRAVKSAAEIAVIRYAYAIAEAGLAAALEAIAPGVTERSVAAAAEAAMRHAGAEGTGIDTIVASGPNNRPILARSTLRPIGADDLVLLTVAPRYEGYHGAIGRPVLLGNPDRAVRAATAAAAQAQAACAAALRPGVEGRAVEAIGRRIMKDADLDRFFLYSGVHSVGVIEFEPPIFGPSSETLLEQNMVISIDIPVFGAPWGGLRVEDGYLITATGAERLNQTPWLLADV